MNSTEMNRVFAYNESPVTFRKGDNVMVNATEMAKPFGKSVADWTRLKSTTEFLEILSSDMQIHISALIQSVKGGNYEQGTWMHEDVALEFARWLSPAFAIWCNKRIKELLTTGQVNMSTMSRKQLAQMVIEAEEENERLMLENKKNAEKIASDAPKVLFAEAVTTSTRSCLIAELAKILQQNGIKGMGQNKLFEWLRKHDYLGKKGEYYNQPTQRAMKLQLFEMKQTVINNPDGSVIIKTTTKVTGRGQVYFINKFLGNNNEKTAKNFSLAS